MPALPPLSPPLWGLVFVLGCTITLWLISLRTRDVSVIDIFWGIGIAGVVDIAAWLGYAGGDRAAMVLFLVNIWAIRLAAHIWTRHEGEDHRYAAMRHQFGRRWWWWSLVQVFLLQAILIWVIAAPPVGAVLNGFAPMGWLDYLGAGIATLAIIFEAVADQQLARFRADPANKGKVMDRGLWGWSRHPNYFGESLLWWGLFAIGFSATGQWWLLVSPVLVTFLLLQVSGVTLMEDKMEDRRPAYAAYKRRVSAFVPWPRRQKTRKP
jgi:steroid 5-alpha reductase family enzyme